MRKQFVKNFYMLKKPASIIFIIVLIGTILFTTLAYRLVLLTKPQGHTQTNNPGITVTVPARPTIPSGPPPPLPPVESPSKVLGIDAKPDTYHAGIFWVRIGYPNCGWGNLHGGVLKSTIEAYHRQGTRVLLTLCQDGNTAHLFDSAPLFDAAQGQPDAVQCGNEEMKNDPSVAFLHIAPENFARFYDLCQYEIHAIRPDIPVLLGSLDPHVGGVDYQPLIEQVTYLNQMQKAMNTIVHPGGHWDWHTQTLGLIDSWHNGWNNGSADASVNSLAHLFQFWAQQFNVNLTSGALGKHLWVVEGTGCFKDCGIDIHDAAQVAISHTLTLIIDVQTAMKYGIPFFYFSSADFVSVGYLWPIGVLDRYGRPKPIRQDLAMGARSLNMSCAGVRVRVVDQETLLAKLYDGCTLPDNYASIVAG
ncbi:MAG: hypothetical protein NVS4B11_28530 [Ktedonobacteraceae bacterium]